MHCEHIFCIIGPIPTPDPPRRGECPDHRWQDFGGSFCYLLHNDIYATWSEANTQ